MMSEHFFLVLEGLDGSGKSELSRRLCALLSDTLGADHVLLSYEPHNPSAAGEYIRDVLGKRITISARTQALAFALNRADHNERVIAPFLDGDQRVIVCDRYYLSSLVYQSTGGLTVEDVMDLNKSARSPDLTLFLDTRPETSEQRIGQRQDHRELFEDRFAETRAKYQHVIEYLRARGEQIEVVDANGTLIEVLNGVIDVLNRRAPNWLRLKRVDS
ncbi:MAG: dTMP kinase [Chloroflexota bacterium]